MVLGTVGLGGTLFPLSGVGVLGSSGSVGFSGSTGGSPGPPGVFGAGKDGLLGVPHPPPGFLGLYRLSTRISDTSTPSL